MSPTTTCFVHDGAHMLLVLLPMLVVSRLFAPPDCLRCCAPAALPPLPCTHTHNPLLLTHPLPLSLLTQTSYEPAEGAASTSATAAYSLTIKGLTVGQTYRVYRTTGLFSSYQIPQSAANLATACAAQGSNCRSIDFTATATSQSVSEASVGTGSTALGRFNARG